MVRLLSPRPEAEARVVGEVREAIEAQRLWRMRPVDALAKRLGVAWEDPRVRFEVDRLLRGVPFDRETGRPATGRVAEEAWRRALDRVRALAPDATRGEVRRAVTTEARHAQGSGRGVDWGWHAAGVVSAVRRTIEQAKRRAEWESLMAAEAEARGRGMEAGL